MSFKLNFNICQSDCDELTFHDITGEYISEVSECCKTGYGYKDNPNKDEVIETFLVVKNPDGDIINTPENGIDLGYVPPVYACGSFDLEALIGLTGSVALIVDGQSIGEAVYTTSLEQVALDLINSVNAETSIHNYQATYTDNGDGTYTIKVCYLVPGTSGNNKTIEVCYYNFTVSVETFDLSGANSQDSWCFDFGSGDIDGTDVNSCFDDGVYEFTYIVRVESDVEDGDDYIEYSKTKKFLFDCMSKACLRELTILAAKGNCSCDDEDIHSSIQKHRTNIESANILFEECEYDCANELIQDTQDFCNEICLDCN